MNQNKHRKVSYHYVRFFDELSQVDIALVGGKNAALAQMYNQLAQAGIVVPYGFAVTAEAYWHVLDTNGLRSRIEQLLNHEGVGAGAAIRSLIEQAVFPEDVRAEIVQAYEKLSRHYNESACSVAVRSSATAEDLPTASFAGQQESYLGIRGADAVVHAVRRCMASLFTDRALVYRQEKKFDHMQVALSVGVQKLVDASAATAGVLFTLDTESGFKDVITINASYGLGQTVVAGEVTPDEYVVYKPFIKQQRCALIRQFLGTKKIKAVLNAHENMVTVEDVSTVAQNNFCLTPHQVQELAQAAVTIETYYSDIHGQWMPMDIEWAYEDGQLYIVQARPETVRVHEHAARVVMYAFTQTPPASACVVTGMSIGNRIVSGAVRIIHDVRATHEFREGDVLVASMTDPDWVPLMKKAAAIITDIGGRTCHAAIVARELGIPAVIGTDDATKRLRDGQVVTLDTRQAGTGYVYDGTYAYTVSEQQLDHLPNSPVDIFVNIADPARAFHVARLPVAGVGLARLEFIINTMVKIHPMALAQYATLSDGALKKHIAQTTAGYENPAVFFVEKVAQAVGMIAAAFYPRPVVVRLSDFKSNEYRNLEGGALFEPLEENPMLGWRGAVRYSDPAYADAFALECAALLKVRDEMGFTNIKCMVPFVRTVNEARATIATLAQHGIVRGNNGLQLYMMVEVPSNVILLNDFAPFFDGFSIGSNDLTQLTLGVDRDSGLLGKLFDERDPAVKWMLKHAVTAAHQLHKPISICGQAPSDFPDIADFLIALGINGLSLNADAVIPFLLRYKQ